MINIHLYPSPFINESRILREARSLAKIGLFDRIDLVGLGQTGLPESENIRDGLRIVRFGQREAGRGVFRKIADTAGWSRAVYRNYRRAPIACISCHSVTALPLAVLLQRATGARIIYDAHELETEANGLRGVRKYLTKVVERSLIRYVDHCIFVGRAIEEWYIREYRLDSTTVLYNCPPRQEAGKTDYFREQFSIPSDQPIFLYQGLIGEGRGIRILVEAFAGLSGRAALVVMGYGALAEWVAEQAAQYKNIYYHPAVPPDRLLAYTGAADYGLSVIEATSKSYEYCMPNKLFEYVMARKPVLVSPTLEQSRFVTRHGIGEVAGSISPEGVRDAVLRLLGRAPASFKHALDRVRQDYCWERQEMKLEAAYLGVLGRCHLLNGMVSSGGVEK
jgi:glycosyltransferase involved in cell wall biosynthesis